MKIYILIFNLLFIKILAAQNVGIGTTTPQAPFHIRSSSAVEMLRIEGVNPYISFFNGPDYSGYLWYNSNKMELGTPSGSSEPVLIAPGRVATAYFTTAGRLGLGISNPAEKLDVNGNINLNGVLKVNGSSGTTGQILTSNGTGDPQWKNAAYSNNTRFSVSFQKNASSSNGYADITATRYNLNTSDISIGSSSIAIDHSGLYHFDLKVRANITYGSSQSVYPSFICWLYTGAPTPYELIDEQIMKSNSTSEIAFRLDEQVSLEVYITAPATLRIYHSYGLSGGISHSVYGFLTGHLISE